MYSLQQSNTSTPTPSKYHIKFCPNVSYSCLVEVLLSLLSFFLCISRLLCLSLILSYTQRRRRVYTNCIYFSMFLSVDGHA